MDRICKHCNGNFSTLSGRVFSNHVKWCDKNPTRGNGSKLAKDGLLEYYDELYGPIKEITKYCKVCNGEYAVICRNSQLNNSRYVMQHCSLKCANTRVHSDEVKNKIKKSMLHRLGIQYPYDKICPVCNLNFSIYNSSESRRTYCSDKCIKQKRSNHLSNISKYRNECSFKFALNNYPDEFDFNLIKQHGWYAASNRGNNLNGISRDHIIPIMYGWKHNISSDIISHPANCQLMRHSDNVSKYTNPGITLEELLVKIDCWNLKYS